MFVCLFLLIFGIVVKVNFSFTTTWFRPDIIIIIYQVLLRHSNVASHHTAPDMYVLTPEKYSNYISNYITLVITTICVNLFKNKFPALCIIIL